MPVLIRPYHGHSVLARRNTWSFPYVKVFYKADFCYRNVYQQSFSIPNISRADIRDIVDSEAHINDV